jgi:putative ATP-binding cassette transporter
MSILKFLWRNSKWSSVLAILTSIISGIVGAALIAFIHYVLSRAPDSSAPNLIWAYCGLCSLLLLSHLLSQILLLYISQGAIYDLRMQLSRSIIRAPLRPLEEAGSPRLMAALTGDASTISGALLGVPIISINIATIVTSLIYIGFLSGRLLLGLFAFMLVSAFIYQLCVRKAMRYLKMAREEADTLFAHFRAIIDGNKELKLNRLRREEFYHQDIKTSASRVRRHNIAGQIVYTAATGFGRLLYFIFIGLILFALPALTPIRTQDLLGYVLVVLYLNGPITLLVNVIPTFNQAKVALQKVQSLGLTLEKEREEDSSMPQSGTDSHWESLALEGVTHTYYREKEDDNFTLGPIDLTCHPGELVFIIGGNGSGKSTLAKILTGLYVPESGKILLDGRPVADETREVYRQMFSAVFSDFYLFERVARSNGSDGQHLDAQAHDYLVELQLDHKVSVKEGLLSTTALSDGQRKRLALLNAYLEDRPLYVFDEWAADQDPLFKRVFYTQILPDLKSRDKTVFVISHDDRFYHIADRIVKLDYGHYVQD